MNEPIVHDWWKQNENLLHGIQAVMRVMKLKNGGFLSYAEDKRWSHNIRTRIVEDASSMDEAAFRERYKLFI